MIVEEKVKTTKMFSVIDKLAEADLTLKNLRILFNLYKIAHSKEFIDSEDLAKELYKDNFCSSNLSTVTKMLVTLERLQLVNIVNRDKVLPNKKILMRKGVAVKRPWVCLAPRGKSIVEYLLQADK